MSASYWAMKPTVASSRPLLSKVCAERACSLSQGRFAVEKMKTIKT
jgi:hypothetical protein